MTKKEVFKKVALIFFAGLAVVFLIITVITAGAGYYAYSQAKVFSHHADISLAEMKTLATDAWNTPLTTTDNQKTILILGIDSLETRGDAPPLTDSMLLASINVETGQISTLAIPRDLWNEAYQTKINALYYYGLDRYPQEPERFPEETLEEMLGVPIHHTVVLSMNSLAEVIDLLGGITVDVPVGFTDNQFPRSDVDVTVEQDPEKLYKTVSFEPGKQLMSGERTLEYIRSRHSNDEEGHDVARSQRQQLVITALMNKIISAQTMTNPALLGDLFKYYQNNYHQYLPVVEVAALIKTLAPIHENIALESHTFSIYPEDENGVIWHPPTENYRNQWVYSIRDNSAIQTETEAKLFQANTTAKMIERTN